MTSFPDADLPLRFEVRFDGTTWVDLSSRMVQGSAATVTAGRPPGSGRAAAAAFSISLDNDDGALTPLNPSSIYWPNVRLDTAARARLRWFEDLFNRNQTDTWGPDWVNSGTASEYDVNGTKGFHTHPTVNVLHTSTVTPPFPTPDVTTTFNVSAVATGANLSYRAVVGADANNNYQARLDLTTAGNVTLGINKVVGGFGSVVLAAVTVGTYGAGTQWSVHAQRLPGGYLRAKAWPGLAEVEPDGWTLSTSIPDTGVTSFPIAAVYSRRETGNTNTDVVFATDYFAVNCHRASGYTDSWQPDFTQDTEGITHSVCRITVSGSTRRLFQDETPIRSALFRTMAGVAPGDYRPFVYWPMEDGSDATRFASGLAGGTPIGSPFAGAVTPADVDGPAGSLPLATLAAGARLPFTIPAYTSTQIAFQWLVRIPAEPAAEMTLAEFYAASGPVRRWKVSVTPGSPAAVWIRDYDAAGTEINAGGVNLSGTGPLNPSETDVFGHWAVLLFGPQQTGGDVSSWLGVATRPPSGAPGYANVDAGTLGRVTGGFLYGGEAGCGIGHLVAYTDPNFDLGFTGVAPKSNVLALDGYTTEEAGGRAGRICDEQSIPILVVGSGSPGMGPQPIGTVSEILGECEDAALAVLGEYELGLSYVTAAARYNQPVTMTVDLAAYRVRSGDEEQVLAPTYDDQNTITESTVTRPDGSFAIIPASRPRSNLPYEDSVTANLADDDQVVQLAAARANRGSIDQMRWPGTPIDLAANPDLIAAWQQATAVPGLGRIVRTGLPAGHAPYDIDELVDGWSETLERRRWKVSYSGQPAAAYDVGQYDDGRSRYGAAGTTTAEALDATETGVDIQVPAGHPGWVTTASHPACYTPAMEIEIDGERMNATACVSTGAGTYTLTVTRNTNGIPGGKSHAAGAAVFIVDTGRYGY